MIRLGAALLGGALLAGCAHPQPILAGRVDPERIAAPTDAKTPRNCIIRKRASLPVRIQGLPLVTAQINGKPATLVLDTGAEFLILSSAAAARLGVSKRYDFQRSMTGIGKTVATGDARLDSMRLGGASIAYPRALVGDVSIDLGGTSVDGLLGASPLADFDLDLDLPHGRLDLYDRLECDSLRPPWSGRYATLETTRSLSQHPFMSVSVNGRKLTASIDSGAQRTVIAARAAAPAGIGADSQLPGPALQTRGMAGETLPASLHLLRDFRVGGIPVRGPVMVVAAALPSDIDALLGLDFLLGHRVWLSYGSRRIFIQPESRG